VVTVPADEEIDLAVFPQNEFNLGLDAVFEDIAISAVAGSGLEDAARNSNEHVAPILRRVDAASGNSRFDQGGSHPPDPPLRPAGRR
jgi:hypothetical protein